MAYNRDNIFAKILRGEIPYEAVYEDDFALSIHDINPLTPIHVLVILKGEYISWADFSANAPIDIIGGFMKAVGATARKLGLEENGYRLLINTGKDANPEISHLHVHILGGKNLGLLLANGV